MREEIDFKSVSSMYIKNKDILYKFSRNTPFLKKHNAYQTFKQKAFKYVIQITKGLIKTKVQE